MASERQTCCHKQASLPGELYQVSCTGATSRVAQLAREQMASPCRMHACVKSCMHCRLHLHVRNHAHPCVGYSASEIHTECMHHVLGIGCDLHVSIRGYQLLSARCADAVSCCSWQNNMQWIALGVQDSWHQAQLQHAAVHVDVRCLRRSMRARFDMPMARHIKHTHGLSPDCSSPVHLQFCRAVDSNSLGRSDILDATLLLHAVKRKEAAPQGPNGKQQCLAELTFLWACTASWWSD